MTGLWGAFSPRDVWLTWIQLYSVLDAECVCLVILQPRRLRGPKPNSCTFNSNLIRALNGFSAQPLSAFTVSLSPNTLSQSLSPSLFFPQPPSIFIITVRLSICLLFFPYPSTILSLILQRISLPLPLRIFQCLVTSSHSHCLLPSRHFIFFCLPDFHLFSQHDRRFCFSWFFLQTQVLHSFFFNTHPISPLEAAARCTLSWCQGTAYHFHLRQRAIENGEYSRRGARHALLGVSQA